MADEKPDESLHCEACSGQTPGWNPAVPGYDCRGIDTPVPDFEALWIKMRKDGAGLTWSQEQYIKEFVRSLL